MQKHEIGKRMIHVRLPEDLHRRVRIQAAESDSTIQDWVVMAIKSELARQDQKQSRTDEEHVEP